MEACCWQRSGNEPEKELAQGSHLLSLKWDLYFGVARVHRQLIRERWRRAMSFVRGGKSPPIFRVLKQKEQPRPR